MYVLWTRPFADADPQYFVQTQTDSRSKMDKNCGVLKTRCIQCGCGFTADPVFLFCSGRGRMWIFVQNLRTDADSKFRIRTSLMRMLIAVLSFAVVHLHSSACKLGGNFTLRYFTRGNAQKSFHFHIAGGRVGILDQSAQRSLKYSSWFVDDDFVIIIMIVTDNSNCGLVEQIVWELVLMSGIGCLAWHYLDNFISIFYLSV